MKEFVTEFSLEGSGRLIGGNASDCDRAALQWRSIVRYFDSNDSYLAVERRAIRPTTSVVFSPQLTRHSDRAPLPQAFGRRPTRVRCRQSRRHPFRQRGFRSQDTPSCARYLDARCAANALAISGTPRPDFQRHVSWPTVQRIHCRVVAGKTTIHSRSWFVRNIRSLPKAR